MKKMVLALVLILAVSGAGFFPIYQAYAEKDVYRVAYIEGDPYVNYAGSLSGIVSGLADNGMVDPVEGWGYEDGSDDASVIWHWLKDHSGDKIEFVQNDFYQLIFMSDEEKRELLRHINQDDQIDLIIVMGTSAAKFVKENNVKTDMMIVSVTNAYEAGIVDGIEYSGIDNIWAHMSPNRYNNQLNVFHKLFKFKKLGIVYENNENGKNEVAYKDIKKFTDKNGIQLIEATINADRKTDSEEAYEEKVIEAYRQLAGNADAVYMTYCGYRTPEKIPQYLAPLYAQGTPVFSQSGKIDVKNGALLSVYRSGFQEIGSFCAKGLIEIMNGKRPGELAQGYDESQIICFNMAAADQAGLKVPFKVLLSADTIFTDIGESK